MGPACHAGPASTTASDFGSLNIMEVECDSEVTCGDDRGDPGYRLQRGCVKEASLFWAKRFLQLR